MSMKTSSSLISTLRWFCLPACLLLAVLPLLAAEDTWSGASSTGGNWSDAGNWDTLPGSGDLLFFAGTTRLSNTNDFTGYTYNGITFNTGTNVVSVYGNAFTLGGGLTNNAGGLVTVINRITLGGSQTISAASNTLVLSGIISGSGSGLVKEGSAVLKLGATNTYTGGTILDAGQTQAAANAAFGTGPVIVNSSAQIVAVGSPRNLSNAVTNNGGTLRNFNSNSTLTFSGGVTLTADSFFNLKYHDSTALIVITNVPITGTNGFTLTDENNVGGTAGSPALLLGVSGNSYRGNTTIASGTLRIYAAAALPSGTGKGNVILDGGAILAGTLDLFGNNTSINGLSGISNSVLGTVLNSSAFAATLTVGNNNATSTFSGILQNGTGSLGLIKTGTGTFTLSGTNNFTGVTSIGSGTLVVNGSLAAGSSVTAQAAGTLTGTGSVYGPVTINGTLVPGTNGLGTLTLYKTLTFSSTGTNLMAIDRTSGTNTFGRARGISTATLNGTLTVTSVGGAFQSGDAFRLFSATNYSGNFTATNLPNISPLAWKWTPANGTLSVVSVGSVNQGSTNITTTVSGSQLILSWPADHTGWHLQVQTNSMATGIGTNWVTIPNTDAGNSYTNIPDPAAPSVFFRMIYP